MRKRQKRSRGEATSSDVEDDDSGDDDSAGASSASTAAVSLFDRRHPDHPPHPCLVNCHKLKEKLAQQKLEQEQRVEKQAPEKLEQQELENQKEAEELLALEKQEEQQAQLGNKLRANAAKVSAMLEEQKKAQEKKRLRMELKQVLKDRKPQVLNHIYGRDWRSNYIHSNYIPEKYT